MKLIRRVLSVAVVATVVAAGAATAQDTDRRDLERRLRQLRQEIRDLERQLGQSGNADAFALAGVPRVLSLYANKARLGVFVQTQADDETDDVGARLSGVEPGGPAEEAGLREGDIITSFDGESLVGRYPAAGRGESEPGKKLVDLVADMEPGAEVSIGYRRGNENRTTTATLEESGDFLSFGRNGNFVTQYAEAAPRVQIRSVGPEGNIFTILRGGLWSDIELVTLNEQLGSYFGTSEGLLVIRAPDEEGVDLQGGDVILNINGREARTPSRALRILQSYEPGETANLQIMRNRRQINVTVTIPERDHDQLEWGRGGVWERRF